VADEGNGVTESQDSGSEQAEFWSKVAERYDRVVDLQIGGRTHTRLLGALAVVEIALTVRQVALTLLEHPGTLAR